jgi:GT2 family glycosyltransferase
MTNTNSDLVNDKDIYKALLVSVIVPWWDHTDLLDIWGNNLQFLEDVDIIFIDNGSQEEGKIRLEDFCKDNNIRLIRNEENLGFSAGNNQGANIAVGEYLVFLNNDIEILEFSKDILCDLATHGIAGPGFLTNELNELYIEGWALCIKASTFKELGGWCEDYGPGYWDDVDLCLRARRLGYTLTPVPNIHSMLRHKQNTTGRDGRINQLALHVRNRGIFLNKHFSISPKFIIDGIFFQYSLTGIARVWISLLDQWSKTTLSQYILVLDRGGTAPKIPGIRYRAVPAHSYDNTEADRIMLQEICDEEGADSFISTYYTIPKSTPSVLMTYDMIPEMLGLDLQKAEWQEKHRAIHHASSFIAISSNTAQDLMRFFPEVTTQLVTVAHCGVSEKLTTASPEEILDFTKKYGIRKPYFLLVGMGFFCVSNHYKNGELFFRGFAQLPNTEDFDIVCTGGKSLDPHFRQYTSGSTVHILNVTDEELRLAYAGAIALVFPSEYEGFGMPIAEAMACGCPVITCSNSSIPEVAGDAVLYVDESNVSQMADALVEIQKPHIRQQLIQVGLQQAHKFTWNSMADKVWTTLLESTLLSLKLRENNYIMCPDWSQSEELIAIDLENALTIITTRANPEQITLLICLDGANPEVADLILSSAAMNLMMTANLDIFEGLEISLVGQLSDLQWQILLPNLNNRLQLKQENHALIISRLSEIPVLTLE